MKNKIKTLCSSLVMTIALALTGCSGNNMEPGYLTMEEVNEIVENFETNVNYTKYHVTGNLNHLNNTDETGAVVVPRTVDKEERFVPTPLTYRDAYNYPSVYRVIKDAMSPAEAISYIDSTEYKADKNIHVKGVVSSVDVDSSGKSYTIELSNGFKVLDAELQKELKSNEVTVAVGDEIVVYGHSKVDEGVYQIAKTRKQTPSIYEVNDNKVVPSILGKERFESKDVVMPTLSVAEAISYINSNEYSFEKDIYVEGTVASIENVAEETYTIYLESDFRIWTTKVESSIEEFPEVGDKIKVMGKGYLHDGTYEVAAIPDSGSYYLYVPLHLNKDSWNYGEGNNITFVSSTRYALESRLYIRGDADKVTHACYYYRGEDGGLKIKVFSQNKALKIRECGIVSHSRWNITVEYDKHGYLVKESFATINAFKDPDSRTCYGEANYEFE